jgi:ATP-dependent Lon protease
MTISVIAPYFFLRHEGIIAEVPDSSLDGLRIFANNYTVQGVKIKACKPALNRVYRHLSRQTSSRLETCPFLTRRHGIYVVDLSFIPEKYRLDVKRAENILNQCLIEWLITVETAASEPMRQAPF